MYNSINVVVNLTDSCRRQIAACWCEQRQTQWHCCLTYDRQLRFSVPETADEQVVYKLTIISNTYQLLHLALMGTTDVFCKDVTVNTDTHTHLFNGPLSGTAWVSRYQKSKTNLDFNEARDSEWQWHQLGHMQVCTSLQSDNHASTPPLSFLQTGCPSCRPTNSVKALKTVQTNWQWKVKHAKNKNVTQNNYSIDSKVLVISSKYRRTQAQATTGAVDCHEMRLQPATW